MPRLLTFRQQKARNVLVYKPSLLDIIAAKQNDIVEAKKRVSVKNGRYFYQPSLAYKHYVARFVKKS
jgi:hypothetical protein